MKRNLLFLIIVCITALSCRKDEEQLQRIDQIVDIYIDSAGVDMLNSKIPQAYRQINLNDVYGKTDTAPVSFQNKTNTDSLHFIQYIAGANRITVDSTDSKHKTLQSKIALNMVKKLTDSTSATTRDTLILNYRFAPEVFELKEAFYNGTKVFSKTDGQPNILKIHK